MEFWYSAIGSFLGAVGGAAAIMLVNYFLYQQKKLATINSTLAQAATNIETLLLLKEQHALPMLNELEDIKKTTVSTDLTQPITVKIEIKSALKDILIPELEKGYPIPEIAQFSHKNTKVVYFLTKSKHYLNEVQYIGESKNNLIKEIRDSKNDNKDYLGFLPGKVSNDDRLFDLTENFLKCIDTALFFNKKAIDAIYILAHDVLPCFSENKLAKINIPQSHQHLMPPEDFIKGF